ncbi:MAG: YHS domain-containing (seleno)protein [Alphaproteobacteria bacterium]
MRVTRFIALFTVPFFLLLAGPAAADKVYTSWGTAIDGYDPVAYFTEGKPVEGDSEFSHNWNGATWHFSSAENRDLFAANPEKYAPQYGGYCAYAVSQGSTASIEPDAWSIVDGKLYLNYSQSVQSKWEKDKAGYITDADANWPDIESGL